MGCTGLWNQAAPQTYLDSDLHGYGAGKDKSMLVHRHDLLPTLGMRKLEAAK